MAASATIPRMRRLVSRPNPGMQRARARARRTAQLALLIPVAVFLVLFTVYELFLHGWQIGGVSPAQRAHHQVETAVNLSGAALIGMAWLLASTGGGRWRLARLCACVAVVALCIVGGITAERLLHHSPAELNPYGGHVKGVLVDGSMYWRALATAALACTLACLAAPGPAPKNG